MPVAASDIRVYGSASMPDDDTPVDIGGAISLSKKVEFTDMPSTGIVEALSDNAGDTTQTVTVTGRLTSGVIATDVIAINGTTPVEGAVQFERILKAVKSASTLGVVTVRTGDGLTDLVVFDKAPNEILEVRRPFYDASAEASGGAARTYYDKVFVRNDHASLALLGAQIVEQADPSAKIGFGVAATLDDTGTNGGGNNRQVAPGGITFNSDAKNVVGGGDLGAGVAQGVWLELTLAAGDAAQKTSYTLRATGTTV